MLDQGKKLESFVEHSRIPAVKTTAYFQEMRKRPDRDSILDE